MLFFFSSATNSLLHSIVIGCPLWLSTSVIRFVLNHSRFDSAEKSWTKPESVAFRPNSSQKARTDGSTRWTVANEAQSNVYGPL